MIGKRKIIWTLLPAYLLLVLHSVIPHHHHYAEEEGPIQYFHGANLHLNTSGHHDDHKDPDCSDHSAHFVHAPEFGQSMVKPGVKWRVYLFDTYHSEYPQLLVGLTILDTTSRHTSFQPDDPLFVDDATVSALALRGPPSPALT